ncbi:substrate-binding periplasmic protein [Chitinimonas sp.]|uniref:substrate-binding periplasmic protein n=1 Tax=Chitinimonas sp. TaxID=1934313 RepID=UPI002F949957
MLRILPLLLAVWLQSPAWAAERVRIGAENDWFPYSAELDGKPVGMAVELVRAAFEQVGIEVELVPLPYARCMKLARESQIAGCFDTLRNPLLEKQYRWHRQPLFKARIDIYAPINHPDLPVSLRELHGKRLAVTNGYDYGEAFDSDATLQRDMGNSDLYALRKLAAGRVDYALVYDRIASHLARSHPDLRGRFKSVGTLIEPDIYLSFAPRYPKIEQLITRFDEGFAKLQQSGRYAEIEARWR